MKIAVHCLVKNEARFLWYSVMSVVDGVDELLLWDTGSTDGTAELIKLIERSSDKVKGKFLSDVTPKEFAKVRQQMLDETDADWFLVVDGDEIWWEESIAQVTRFIRRYGKEYESVVVPTVNLVGDMYHYQEKAAGNYRIAGRKGHLGLRAIKRSIPGLKSDKPHGTWGWVDRSGKMIQDRDPNKIKFLDTPYLHATFLPRAGIRSKDFKVPKRARKLKHEIGISFAKDYFYPEVFFRPRPKTVKSPWETMSASFKQRALIETSLRKIKRRVLPAGVGY